MMNVSSQVTPPIPASEEDDFQVGVSLEQPERVKPLDVGDSYRLRISGHQNVILTKKLFSEYTIADATDDFCSNYWRGLSPEVQELLSCARCNTHKTPEYDSLTATDYDRDIRRAMSRDYWFKALFFDQAIYEKFIADQMEASDQPLSEASFNELKSRLSSLTDEQFDALRVVNWMTAVALSPAIREKASQCLEEIPEDSITFLEKTTPFAAKIFGSVVSQLYEKYPGAERWLEVAFMPGHMRHMMNCEGSRSMYHFIEQGFANGTLSEEDFNVWLARWIVDIIGLRGGTEFMDENVYQQMTIQRQILSGLRIQGHENPMESSLKSSLERLKLPQTLASDEKQALALMAPLLYVSNSEQGQELVNGFQQLSLNDQKRWIAHYQRQLEGTGYPAPTYAPAFFKNLGLVLTKRNGDQQRPIAQVIKIGIKVYLDVMQIEIKQRRDGVIRDTQPVSFYSAAKLEQLEGMLEKGLDKLNIEIAPKGAVSFN